VPVEYKRGRPRSNEPDHSILWAPGDRAYTESVVPALVQLEEIHRLSIEEYHRLIDSGGLEEGSRVELIDGLVVDMSPRSPQHENAIQWLIRWLVAQLDHSRFDFRIAGSLTLGRSEPEPDVAILERTPPRRAHPSHALLVIEVAISSRDRDLRSKPAVYAPYVDEYWVVDLQRAAIVVHRDPAGGAYGEVAIIPRGERLAPLAVPIAPLASDELFAYAFAEHA
jgi:Uma2 family endonuclease